MKKQQYFEAELLATALMIFPIITLILAVVAGVVFPAADIYAGVIARSFIAMFVSAPLGYGISRYCESKRAEVAE